MVIEIEISRRKKFDYFRIVLDKPNGIYFPGECLTGKVMFKANERIKINGVKILVEGTTKVGKNQNENFSYAF